MLDDKGTDAILLYDSNSWGHIGALIDDGDGNWYLYYYGAANREGCSGASSLLFTSVSSAVNEESTLTKVSDSDVLGYNGIISPGKEFNSYDKAFLLEGDFSDSFTYAKEYTALTETKNTYKLFSNNCSNVTFRILAQSDTSYKTALEKASKKTLPANAYNSFIKAMAPTEKKK